VIIDEIVERAIEGHASTRDAIRWAIETERKECMTILKQMLLPGRFNDRHLGFGDIRLTIADQEAIMEAIRKKG
jgi:hypothetical protein